MRPTKPYVKRVAVTKKRKAHTSAHTREALVRAAMVLFAEQGLAGPSLDAICARAGFTRGAFYVHFADREAIVTAVIEQVMGGFIDAIIASGEAGADITMIVQTFAMAVTTGAFPFRGQVRPHQILEACAKSPALHAKYLELLERARARLALTVERGQAAGTLRRDLDPAAVAQLLLAVVLGVEVATELRVPYDAMAVSREVLKLVRP